MRNATFCARFTGTKIIHHALVRCQLVISLREARQIARHYSNFVRTLRPLREVVVVAVVCPQIQLIAREYRRRRRRKILGLAGHSIWRVRMLCAVTHNMRTCAVSCNLSSCLFCCVARFFLSLFARRRRRGAKLSKIISTRRHENIFSLTARFIKCVPRRASERARARIILASARSLSGRNHYAMSVCVR